MADSIVDDQANAEGNNAQRHTPLAGALPPMLTAQQVADLLMMRRQQVYALTREGLIPSIRVGRTIRYNRDRLLEWMDEGGAGLEGDTK